MEACGVGAGGALRVAGVGGCVGEVASREARHYE